ncbi:glycosyltransferase [Pseudoroseicyclus tamaricis]|uniref:Glycosyltransferase n=1 Tax=Pseudoroseicyclus tamaricis TaxID=2705421 RepID=A0A6B2K0Q8_9RHOB|nr:glycosyltransferase family 2 protein [Pseudoroseicyclus tamaricis]NDV02024.1 glycosyltransferase [Pseudoroseicyclus tamaricis]
MAEVTPAEITAPVRLRRASPRARLRVDPLARRADPRLIARLGAEICLTDQVLPWRREGGATILLAMDAETVRHRLPAYETVLGPVRLAAAPPGRLAEALTRDAGALLALEAEERLPPSLSCRGLGAGTGLRGGVGIALLLALAALLAAPGPVFLALCLLTALLGAAFTVLRLLALFAAPPSRPALPAPVAPAPELLPRVSLFVPLYQEREIAGALLRRLGRLDYPTDRLDLCLILEADDPQTEAALARTDLPPHARVIRVPAGGLRTKPRALNYALTLARGQIIGIYDAEDAPAPDQLRRVAARFATAPPQVGCLQGALDFYNSGSNWVAGCFTLEYAAWFRVLLPGLAALDLPVPLGGTTLFLRRDVLTRLGGWDAHNVTEDADLGLRLHRAGYRTELIDTVTQEEAANRPRPWIRQRSRWLKGYALTWASHMRHPAALLRDLGWRGFWAVQLLFLGTLAQFLLAPVGWSFWALALGLPHVLATLPAGLILGILALQLVTLAVSLLTFAIAAARSGRPWMMLSYPLLWVYFPMATLALLKALRELVAQPFYWDKTSHGHSQPDEVPRPTARHRRVVR